MYVKTTTRRVKGGQVRYLHLAHNEWDAAARRSVPKLLYSFGREDQLDKDAVRRLVASLARLLDPGDALPVPAAGDLAFSESRPYGGAYVLDALWNRLGIGSILSRLRASGRGRPRDAAATERVLTHTPDALGAMNYAELRSWNQDAAQTFPRRRNSVSSMRTSTACPSGASSAMTSFAAAIPRSR